MKIAMLHFFVCYSLKEKKIAQGMQRFISSESRLPISWQKSLLLNMCEEKIVTLVQAWFSSEPETSVKDFLTKSQERS